MKNIWEHHFKYYDLFQNGLDNYRATIDFHLKNLRESHKILDTGAGTGNLTLELLKFGHMVIAVDSNKLALDILETKCREYNRNLAIKQIEVELLNFHEEFDGVSSMFVIPFVKNNKRYFSNVYNALRSNGMFIISAWAPIKNGWSKLKDIVEDGLRSKGLLPKYQKEFNYISESSEVNGKIVSEGQNVNDIKDLLSKMGFVDIKEFTKNPYGKYAYFLTCKKR